MKYFFDTEFHEYEIKDDLYHQRRPTIDLISIGIVAEDGRELYRVNTDFSINPACANEWLLANVIQPLCFELDPEVEWRFGHNANLVYEIITQNSTKSELVKSNYNIKQDIIAFVGNDPDPQFYAYYADYDWVVFCWLFGRMIDLPPNFPMYCRDLKQMLDEYCDGVGVSIDTLKALKGWPTQENEHNALDDARWNQKLWAFLQNDKKVANRIIGKLSTDYLQIPVADKGE